MTLLTPALARFPQMPADEHLRAVTAGGSAGMGISPSVVTSAALIEAVSQAGAV